MPKFNEPYSPVSYEAGDKATKTILNSLNKFKTLSPEEQQRQMAKYKRYQDAVIKLAKDQTSETTLAANQ